MRFAYQRRPIEPTPLVEGDSVWRPLIPVEFVTHRDLVTVWALADTGADHTLVPTSLAEAIGMTVYDDEVTTLQGFGGKELSVQSGLADMVIRDDRRPYHWVSRVGVVTFDDPEDEVVVLGYGGFFEFFAATFDSHDRSVSLIPTPAFPVRNDT